MELQSSYRKNNYGEVFEALSFIQRPRLTVEIGVLEGYSALHLSKYSEKVILCDIFDRPGFKGKHADKADIEYKFPDADVVQMDFFEDAKNIIFEPIDLLHIDIANSGDTYRYFLEQYYPRLAPGGMAILEGGSEERDNYWWMKAFNRPSIREALKEFTIKGIDYHVIEAFPSLTIVRK